MLSDKTKIHGYTWKALKDQAMKPDFMESKWFVNDFTNAEKETVKRLIEA